MRTYRTIKLSNYIEIFDGDVANVLYYLSVKFCDHDSSPIWYFSLFSKFCPNINLYQLIFSCLFSAEKFHPNFKFSSRYLFCTYGNSTMLKLLHLSKCTYTLSRTISRHFMSPKLSFFIFCLISIDMS